MQQNFLKILICLLIEFFILRASLLHCDWKLFFWNFMIVLWFVALPWTQMGTCSPPASSLTQSCFKNGSSFFFWNKPCVCNWSFCSVYYYVVFLLLFRKSLGKIIEFSAINNKNSLFGMKRTTQLGSPSLNILFYFWVPQ